MSAGVVAALAAEARTLGPTVMRRDGLLVTRGGILVAVSGMGGEAAAVAARALVDAGATALVSWGLAGGLDPALPAGTICLPDEVVAPSFEERGPAVSFATHAQWRAAVGASVTGRRIVGGSILSLRGAIETAADKAVAFRDTGAAAVDLESASVAHVAASRGLSFIAVRVIVDTAADSLPRAVLMANNGGRLRLARLLQGVLLSPSDIAPLLRLAGRYRAATRSLAAVGRSRTLAPPDVASPTGKRPA